MLPVNYCPGFTSLKLYGHVKFSISIMYALCIATHYIVTLLFLCSNFKLSLLLLYHHNILLINFSAIVLSDFLFVYSILHIYRMRESRCSKYFRFGEATRTPFKCRSVAKNAHTFLPIQQNSHKTHYV